MPISGRTGLITALRELPGGRVEVSLDGTPWRSFGADVVVRAGLGVGRELDRPLARALARALRRDRALTRATRALASRDLAAVELDCRLSASGTARGLRAEVLGTLERAGLLDDRRFAAERAATLASRGYGDGAIRAELEARGVAPDAVATVLSELEPERVRADRVLARRGRSARTARWLARRGFDEDVVAAAGDAPVAENGC